LVAPKSLKYSDFCDIFVPKSQKVLAELAAKKPKNLEGHLSYTQCFDTFTRSIYAQAWEHVIQSAERENTIKIELMRDAHFDVSQSFREFTDGNEITRDDLLEVMRDLLDTPHIDILFAKLCSHSTSKNITYARFIESITP
jgi:hypothetical protein